MGKSTSIDPEEIRRFSEVADDWWLEDGAFAPLHRFTPVRLEFMRDAIATVWPETSQSDLPLADRDILDIGCGGGLLSEPMTRLGGRVTGIDAAGAGIEAARAHAAISGLDIDYRMTAVEDLDPAIHQFDMIVASEVVEHVADLPLFAAACARILKPGGLMFLTTINRTLKSLALAKVGAEYILRWAPVGTHDWDKFVTPDELRSVFAAHSIRLETCEGFAFNPLQGRFFRSSDLTVNYGAFGVRDD